MPEAPDTTTTPDGTDPASAAPPATEPTGSGQEPPAVPDADETPSDTDQADKDKIIASVRRENAKWREKTRSLEAQMAGIAKALNPDATDGKPDSDAVIADLAAQKRENLVLRYATKNGGDPDALIDSRSFNAAIADIDPSAPDASDLIAEAIKEAIAKDSRLAKPTIAPQKAGGGQHGGGHQAKPPKSLDEAVSAAYAG